MSLEIGTPICIGKYCLSEEEAYAVLKSVLEDIERLDRLEREKRLTYYQEIQLKILKRIRDHE